MTEEPPKIIFPCEYPIKVLGRACEAFQPTVMAIFHSHAEGCDVSGVVVKDSRKGTFQSMTITIEAKSEEQPAAAGEQKAEENGEEKAKEEDKKPEPEAKKADDDAQTRHRPETLH